MSESLFQPPERFVPENHLDAINDDEVRSQYEGRLSELEKARNAVKTGSRASVMILGAGIGAGAAAAGEFLRPPATFEEGFKNVAVGVLVGAISSILSSSVTAGGIDSRLKNRYCELRKLVWRTLPTETQTNITTAVSKNPNIDE